VNETSPAIGNAAESQFYCSTRLRRFMKGTELIFLMKAVGRAGVPATASDLTPVEI
jgi:hypothetical protein